MDAKMREQELLEAAVKVAVNIGWAQMTRADIARQAGCSEALVTGRLGLMDRVRLRVMRAAVTHSIVPVIAQGLAIRHPATKRATEAQRTRAAEYVRRG